MRGGEGRPGNVGFAPGTVSWERFTGTEAGAERRLRREPGETVSPEAWEPTRPLGRPPTQPAGAAEGLAPGARGWATAEPRRGPEGPGPVVTTGLLRLRPQAGAVSPWSHAVPAGRAIWGAGGGDSGLGEGKLTPRPLPATGTEVLPSPQAESDSEPSSLGQWEGGREAASGPEGLGRTTVACA